MRTKVNEDIRKRITRIGRFDWQIARKIGISPSTFCIWMREPLAEGDERRERIEAVLTELEECK